MDASSSRSSFAAARLDEIQKKQAAISLQNTMTAAAAHTSSAQRASSQPNGGRIMIAVCGMTGTGKSTFIQRLSGKQVKVGHGLFSQTYDPEEVPCTIDSLAVTLVDTPGFDDTTRTDAEVLQSLADWMEKSYVAGTLLSGIIYLHRITDVRMTHASMRNLGLFRKLCGDENLSNVMLVTSWWEVCDPEVALAREGELKAQGSFWGTMIQQGAMIERYNNQPAAAEGLVRKLMRKDPVAMRMQRQLVEEHLPLAETDAGQEVRKAMIELEKKHQENLAALKDEMERARTQSNEALKKDLEIAHARAVADIQKVQEAKVKLLENRVRRVQLEAKQEMRAQKEEYDVKMEKSQEENRKGMEKMRQDHWGRISELRDENARAMSDLEKSHGKDMRDLEVRSKKELSNMRSEHSAALHSAVQKGDRAVQEIKERQEAERKRQQSELSAMRSEHSAALQTAVQNGNRAVQEIQNRQESERSRQNSEIQRLREKVDSLQSEASAATRSSGSGDSSSVDALAVVAGILYGAAANRARQCPRCGLNLTKGMADIWLCGYCSMTYRLE